MSRSGLSAGPVQNWRFPMPSVDYEDLYAALITLFAVLAVFVGGWDVPATGESRLKSGE